jgi:hypothetical protein
MSATEPLVPEISEPLTWSEICARYPDEWVCVVEMDFVRPNGPELRSARVVGHGKTRSAPIGHAKLWRDRYEIGHFFTGRITVRSLLPLRPQVILDEETLDAFRYRR